MEGKGMSGREGRQMNKEKRRCWEGNYLKILFYLRYIVLKTKKWNRTE